MTLTWLCDIHYRVTSPSVSTLVVRAHYQVQ